MGRGRVNGPRVVPLPCALVCCLLSLGGSASRVYPSTQNLGFGMDQILGRDPGSNSKSWTSGTGDSPLAMAVTVQPPGGVEETSSQSCNRTEEDQVRAFFKDIVLVVHCDDDRFEAVTSQFWRKVHGSFFNNIVFVSARPDPQLGIEPQAARPWRWDWHYSYFALPKIMARYPLAEGFLWANDDVIINYWNLLQADKTKLWLPNNPNSPETRHFPFERETGTESKWPTDWAGDSDRREQALKAFASLDWPRRQKYNDSVAPLQGVYPKRVCDLFYVPRRHVEDFAFDLVPLFREARVASQVAIPMMFYGLEHPKHFDRVLDDMVFRWDHFQERGLEEGRKEVIRDLWSPEVSALKPWKVRDAEGQRELLKVLSDWDSCIFDRVEVK